MPCVLRFLLLTVDGRGGRGRGEGAAVARAPQMLRSHDSKHVICITYASR